ncbi:MAG: glycine cleavage system protein GcvH [Propionibacteriales bacterium]|nr:glycine cleavage system protein GcvH [Propionibacteriales bacterium]
MNPDDVKYTAEHEWVRDLDGDTVRVGITDFAQEALGDIVYVQLPEVGADVVSGSPMGELESTKSVSDLFAPLSGTVTACNDALDAAPELCNADPYGEGWIAELRISDPAQREQLLSAADYEATVASN